MEHSQLFVICLLLVYSDLSRTQYLDFANQFSSFDSSFSNRGSGPRTLDQKYYDLHKSLYDIDPVLLGQSYPSQSHQVYPTYQKPEVIYDPRYYLSPYSSGSPVSPAQTYRDAMLNTYGGQYGVPLTFNSYYGADLGQGKAGPGYEPLNVYPPLEARSYQPTYQPAHQPDYQSAQPAYFYVAKKVIKPVKLPKVVEKKPKIVSVDKGFYVAGGTQIYGNFKSIKGCMKACAEKSTCFAGDYNPWLKKCYFHSNMTACGTLRSHSKVTHFKKVPCTVPEAPRGLVIMGAQLHFGVEQKTIHDLASCLKKCATVGSGIPATNDDIRDQICFGIDYDFATHTCYFHVRNTRPDNRICGATVDPLPTPRDLVGNPSTVFIALCPDVA